jgi:hypothetical protein
VGIITVRWESSGFCSHSMPAFPTLFGETGYPVALTVAEEVKWAHLTSMPRAGPKTIMR